MSIQQTGVMTPSGTPKVQTDLLTEALSVMAAKRPGYTVGSADRLANFKAVATRSGLTPQQVWLVYFLKHIDAIQSIMAKPELPVSEAPRGRFIDAINYLLLGYELWEEQQPRAAGAAGTVQSINLTPPQTGFWYKASTPASASIPTTFSQAGSGRGED